MSGGAPFTLVSTGLSTPDQGFTNCVYVSPDDMTKLADMAGIDPRSAAERGIQCAVGQGIFFAR